MKKFLNSILWIFVLLSVGTFFIPPGKAGGQEPSQRHAIAVFAFEMLCDAQQPLDVQSAVQGWLADEGIDTIAPEKLERFFVERRIRRVNVPDRAVLREMGESLAADAVLMGSVNSVSVGENPAIDLTAQLLATADSSIVWMNSVSMSGKDFETILGLGKVRSLDKLMPLAIDRLLQDMRSSLAKLRETSAASMPFEVAQTGFYPQTVRGGEKVGVLVEIKDITGMPGYMNAVVAGTTVTLALDREHWYKGFFNAPDDDGTYELKVRAFDKWNELYEFEGLGTLVVDNSPPRVSISRSRTWFSPNRDGINDSVLFVPQMLSADNLKQWSFEIADSKGNVIRSEYGRGDLPGGLIWRGENDKFKPADNGTYFARLTVEDKAGNRTQTSKLIVVLDRLSPEIELTERKRENDVVEFQVEFSNFSTLEEWTIRVYDSRDDELASFRGNEQVPETLQCAFKKKTSKTGKKHFFI